MGTGASARTRIPLAPPFLLFLGATATLPFAWPPLVRIGASAMRISDLLLGLAYAAIAASWIRRRERPGSLGLLAVSIVFVSSLAISIPFSDRPILASVLKLMAFGMYVLLPWLSANLIDTQHHLKVVVNVWIVAASVVVCLCVIQIVTFYLGGWELLRAAGCTYGAVPAGPYPRICLPLLFPNGLANYLTTVFPLVWLCSEVVLSERLRRALRIACVVSVILTLSTGIGGLALAALVVVVGTKRGRPFTNRQTLAAAGLVGVVVLTAVATTALAVPDGLGQISIGDRDIHLAKAHRVFIWIHTAGVVADDPLTGLGYGSLVSQSPQHDMSNWARSDLASALEDPPRPLPADAHNTWLSVAAQSGLPALAAFILLLAVILKNTTFHPLPGYGPLRYLPVALAASIIGAFFFHGLFASLEESRHTWALMGLIVAARKFVEARPREDQIS